MATDVTATRSVTVAIEARLANVVLVSACVRGPLAMAFGESTASEVELAIVEAVNNAIQHAYDGRAGGQVTVELTLADDRLEVAVCDTGRALDPRRLEQPHTALEFDENDLGAIPEGGMGLAIIASAMDEVGYASGSAGNRLGMVRYRSGAGGQDRRTADVDT